MSKANAASTFGPHSVVPGDDTLEAEPSIHAAVQRLAKNWSIELTPREVGRLGGRLTELVPAGTRVYLTWLAGSAFADSLDAARRLRRSGMTPVPHLAARAIQDEAQLSDMLIRLRGEADVEQALLIAGALKQPAGTFDSCMQVLQVRQFERHGMRRLGLAAHPEGSPDIPPAALSRALAEKNAYAARSDIAFELMTQFCFDAAVITEWERQVRAAGNRLPVAVGLAGLASVTTLIKHARSCGVGNSIGLLLKHASKLRQLASAVDPSGIVLDLARAKQADHACAIARLHFFPFGSFAATARFARALAEGDFTIEKDLRRIRVHQ